MKTDDCNNLSKRYKVTISVLHIFHLIYSVGVAPFAAVPFVEILFIVPNSMQTAREYKLADLTPMESGCCRPPAEYAPECPPQPFPVVTVISDIVIISSSHRCDFQVRVPSSECILFRSELSSGEHQRRLQTVQERPICQVLRLQFLQVSHSDISLPKLRSIKTIWGC